MSSEEIETKGKISSSLQNSKNEKPIGPKVATG